MIKGINKRILEITNTNNDVFEKAVLYIRADKSGLSGSRLEQEARDYLDTILPLPKEKAGGKINPAVKLVCAAAFVLSAVILFALLKTSGLF